MGMGLRAALRKLEEGKNPADAFKLEDGTKPLREHYEEYVNCHISEADKAYILEYSDPDAVSEFDALVDEYNNQILVAAELDEKLWIEEGIREGFIKKAEAMLGKIKEFDQRVCK